MSSHTAPEVSYEFHHALPVQIRFNDIDVLGHLNNAIYLQFMDLGKANYFRQFMDGGRFNWDALGLVIANINIDFLAPTFIHEDLQVLTAVASIGCKSLVLDQRVVSITTGEVKASAKVTMVCYNTKTGATEVISDEWRHKISVYEGRQFV
ncbi:MAG: acyl-CoA thioesterase [Muribaculaceae bacterium]|nr:acyl-CoA thioesterase [Muribaculaceae bacterium]